MNKFIEYDLYDGVIHLKCAIMNILIALDAGETNSYKFGPWVSIHLVRKCMEDSGWSERNGFIYSPAGNSFRFTDDVDLTIEKWQK